MGFLLSVTALENVTTMEECDFNEQTCDVRVKIQPLDCDRNVPLKAVDGYDILICYEETLCNRSVCEYSLDVSSPGIDLLMDLLVDGLLPDVDRKFLNRNSTDIVCVQRFVLRAHKKFVVEVTPRFVDGKFGRLCRQRLANWQIHREH